MYERFEYRTFPEKRASRRDEIVADLVAAEGGRQKLLDDLEEARDQGLLGDVVAMVADGDATIRVSIQANTIVPEGRWVFKVVRVEYEKGSHDPFSEAFKTAREAVEEENERERAVVV